jgi:hypothetical protein
MPERAPIFDVWAWRATLVGGAQRRALSVRPLPRWQTDPQCLCPLPSRSQMRGACRLSQTTPLAPLLPITRVQLIRNLHHHHAVPRHDERGHSAGTPSFTRSGGLLPLLKVGGGGKPRGERARSNTLIAFGFAAPLRRRATGGWRPTAKRRDYDRALPEIMKLDASSPEGDTRRRKRAMRFFCGCIRLTCRYPEYRMIFVTKPYTRTRCRGAVLTTAPAVHAGSGLCRFRISKEEI